MAFQSLDKKSDDEFNSQFLDFDQCAELLIKNLTAFVSQFQQTGDLAYWLSQWTTKDVSRVRIVAKLHF